MNSLTGRLRWFIALAILVGVGAAFLHGVSGLRVDNDITAALPEDDPVVAAGGFAGSSLTSPVTRSPPPI